MKPEHDNPIRRSCSLMVTHQCNLKCVYCYESYKSDKTTPLELAKRIITSEFEFVSRSAHFDELAIDFMGGEPLIAFDLIRKIAEWIWSEPHPVPYILFTTTNGTLLNKSMKEWFRLHKEQFYVSLSLDGTPDMQNANRGHRFDRIDLNFFLDNWPDQPVKMTVSSHTMDSMAEGILYLHERGFKVGTSLGRGMQWDERSVKEFKRQLWKLAKYYLDHERVAPVLLDLSIQQALGKQPFGQKKYCGTGTHMATYDVDGKVYPCHMFGPIVLGASKSDVMQAINFQQDAMVTDVRCSNCVIRNICPTCYGLNYKFTGDVARRDPMMCQLFKVQASANCWFHTQLIRRKRRVGSLSLEDARNAKACLKIMQQLSEERRVI